MDVIKKFEVEFYTKITIYDKLPGEDILIEQYNG